MNKIPKFEEGQLAKFENHKIANLMAIVGGQKYSSTWSSSGGSSGTDTIDDATYDNCLKDKDNCCHNMDFSINKAAAAQLQTGDPVGVEGLGDYTYDGGHTDEG